MKQRRIPAILLSAVLLGSMAGCGSADNSSAADPAEVQRIVEEIAVDYGTYGADCEEILRTAEETISKDTLH